MIFVWKKHVSQEIFERSNNQFFATFPFNFLSSKALARNGIFRSRSTYPIDSYGIGGVSGQSRVSPWYLLKVGQNSKPAPSVRPTARLKKQPETSGCRHQIEDSLTILNHILVLSFQCFTSKIFDRKKHQKWRFCTVLLRKIEHFGKNFPIKKMFLLMTSIYDKSSNSPPFELVKCE